MADLTLFELADSVKRVGLASLGASRQPTRAFVASGPQFAHDCWLLAVSVPTVQTGQIPSASERFDVASVRSQPRIGTRTLLLVATLVLDCLPTVEVTNGTPILPSVDELQDAAALVLGDSWDLYLGIKRAALASELFEDEAGEPLFADPGCVGVDVGDLAFFGPQGRTAGASLPIRVIIP